MKLSLVLFAALASPGCLAFGPSPFAAVRPARRRTDLSSTRDNPPPEFTVVEDEDEYMVTRYESFPGTRPEVSFANAAAEDARASKPEYGAMAPGTVAQVRMGDLSLARKAWKKRRRSGSPLLAPCSVLNVDRRSMVRWNLVHLLEKFGKSRVDGISLSVGELAKWYRGYLKSSMSKQALALGHESNHELIEALFEKVEQETYGVRLIKETNSNGDEVTSLMAPISRVKGHRRAANVPLLQFRELKPDEFGDRDSLIHTGYIRARTDIGAQTSFNGRTPVDQRKYEFLPLSAAIRLSQKEDLDSGRVEPDSVHQAFLFDYDAIGDGGSPLLTLSLNSGETRQILKLKPEKKHAPVEKPQFMIDDISIGDGPYTARVVRLMRGRALVDCQAGREVQSKGIMKVIGTLRFTDAVDVVNEDGEGGSTLTWFDEEGNAEEFAIDSAMEEVGGIADDERDGIARDLLSMRDESTFEPGVFEEGETEEEVTDMYQVDESGQVYFVDPTTGEQSLATGDEGEFNMEVDGPAYAPKQLKVGDEFQVYIRSVSKQSSQFSVTMREDVKGKRSKELKVQDKVDRHLKRLEKKLGRGGLERIQSLQGQECHGTVQAVSKTGDWLYVKPDLEDIPVGVATINVDSTFQAGDQVTVTIEGIDDSRGQIAMKVVGSP